MRRQGNTGKIGKHGAHGPALSANSLLSGLENVVRNVQSRAHYF